MSVTDMLKQGMDGQEIIKYVMLGFDVEILGPRRWAMPVTADGNGWSAPLFPSAKRRSRISSTNRDRRKLSVISATGHIRSAGRS